MGVAIAVVTYLTPSRIDVTVGNREVRVGGDANIGNPGAPYFVFTNTMTAWQPPHEHEAISVEDKESVLRAIREYLENKGMAYLIDPTDEQYRSC